MPGPDEGYGRNRLIAAGYPDNDIVEHIDDEDAARARMKEVWEAGRSYLAILEDTSGRTLEIRIRSDLGPGIDLDELVLDRFRHFVL